MSILQKPTAREFFAELYKNYQYDIYSYGEGDSTRLSKQKNGDIVFVTDFYYGSDIVHLKHVSYNLDCSVEDADCEFTGHEAWTCERNSFALLDNIELELDDYNFDTFVKYILLISNTTGEYGDILLDFVYNESTNSYDITGICSHSQSKSNQYLTALLQKRKR